MKFYECKDYYRILNVKNNAEKEEIRKAYLDAVKKYHPDKFILPKEKEKAEEKIKEINEAYEILYNKNLREIYDENCYNKYFNTDNSNGFIRKNGNIKNKNGGTGNRSKIIWTIFIVIILIVIYKLRTIHTIKSHRINYYPYYNYSENRYQAGYGNYKNSDVKSILRTKTTKIRRKKIPTYLQTGFLHEYSGEYKKAKLIFEKACDNNIAKGCYHLGNLYFNGYGVKKNYKKAMKLYQKACNEKYVVGCCKLGNMYMYGYGINKNYIKARELFLKSCNAKYSRGCYKLAILYLNGLGVKKDTNKAKRLFCFACRKEKVKEACILCEKLRNSQ